MVEITLPVLAGKEVRYGDDTWELTGVVEVGGTGEYLEAEAEQVDDVRHRTARLHFGLENPPASLNPGNVGDYFEQLQREGDEYHLLVKTDERTYRYGLNSVGYE